jgi:hypothetical protein
LLRNFFPRKGQQPIAYFFFDLCNPRLKTPLLQPGFAVNSALLKTKSPRAAELFDNFKANSVWVSRSV